MALLVQGFALRDAAADALARGRSTRRLEKAVEEFDKVALLAGYDVEDYRVRRLPPT